MLKKEKLSVKVLRPKILSEVVESDYCCGCGTCAGSCSKEALMLNFNEYGEYNPELVEGCNGCRLCERVCPFMNGNPNEDELGKELFGINDGIGYRQETGYFYDCFVGRVKEHKKLWRTASGGLTSWILEQLLVRKIVDYVVTVGGTRNSEKLFSYRIIKSPSEIWNCGKSVYYPVEMSQVLSQIRQNEGSYAIVGLPCFIKGIQLLRKRSAIYKKRVKYTLALTCGHQNSKFYGEYTARLAGIKDFRKISRISFREKEEEKPAYEYLFKCFGKNSDEELARIEWSKGYRKPQMHDYFILNSCRYCDDIYGECADISLMDAWLPEYWNDPRGTSLAIVRNEKLKTLIQSGQDEGLEIKPISVDKVIESQEGALRRKRSEIKYYLKNSKGKFPQKREHLIGKVSHLRKEPLYAWIKVHWNRAAREAFRIQKQCGKPGLSVFKRHFYLRSLSVTTVHVLFSLAETLLLKIVKK